MFVTALLAAAALQTGAGPDTLHNYGGLTLDPAGRRIAAIESDQVRDAPSASHGVIVVRGTDGRIAFRIDPCGECRYSGPTWSPDGSKLAYLAASGGSVTLYVTEVGTRDVRSDVITRVEGLAQTPRWSADGSQLAVLATLNPSKETGATQAGARQVGEMSELSTDSQRIAVVPAAGGDLRMVSPDGTFVYEYDWMPDASGFVATAAKGNGDNNWWIAKLEAFGMDGSERVVLSPTYQMNGPKVSPDGKTIAFIGGIMSDFGPSGGDVYTVPVAGGAETDVTPDAPITFTHVAWRGDRIIAGVIKGGDTGTAVVNPAARTFSDVNTQAASLGAGDGRVSLNARGDRAAMVTETYDRAPRIEFGRLGRASAITHDNDALHAAVSSRSVTWTNEGLTVQGWLIGPTTLTEGAKYPMIVNVHGGPSSAVTPRFVFSGANRDLVEAGYFVFQPNPRGSYGQGAAFERANIKDFGGGDLRDIMAGIDAVEAVAPVDEARLGIYGHSYGGFMTMWTVAHSQRFHAAVSGAGIANWGSYYGQNGIDQWMTPFFGAPFYDDPSVYDRLSPIRTIRDAHTPTFLYVGERDLETPAPQSMEYWHGLVSNGTPTSLVIYQDEGHGIRQPEHILDLSHRIVGWFDRYLKPAA